MKNTIFTILLLFIACSGSFAQKFEIGLSGGTIFNSRPPSLHTYDAAADRYFLTSLKAAYNNKEWQYGISAGYGRSEYNGREYYLPMGGNSYSAEILKTDTRVPLGLFVNRKITLSRFEAYSGFTSIITFENNKKELINNPDSWLGSPGDFYWLSGGVQAGCNYMITKHIGINAETGALCNYHLNGSQRYYSTFSFPVKAGVICRF